MANNLASLQQQLDFEVNVIRVKTSELAKKVAIQVLNIAIDATAIDTSKAISNWQVSLDNPKENPIEAYFKGKHGSTEEQSETATKGTAVDVLRNKKAGQSIFITNNSYLAPDTDRPQPNSPEDYFERSKIEEGEVEAYEQGLILVASAEALLRDK